MSDEIQMLPVPDTSQITEFGAQLIRRAAESLGITYEQLSAEYEAVNWSAARRYFSDKIHNEGHGG